MDFFYSLIQQIELNAIFSVYPFLSGRSVYLLNSIFIFIYQPLEIASFTLGYETEKIWMFWELEKDLCL